MDAFQSLSIPKPPYGFTETRNRTISSSGSRVVTRVVPNNHLKHNCTTDRPSGQTKHRSHNRLMLRNQWNTGPGLSGRSKQIHKIEFHCDDSFRFALLLLCSARRFCSLRFFFGRARSEQNRRAWRFWAWRSKKRHASNATEKGVACAMPSRGEARSTKFVKNNLAQNQRAHSTLAQQSLWHGGAQQKRAMRVLLCTKIFNSF